MKNKEKYLDNLSLLNGHISPFQQCNTTEHYCSYSAADQQNVRYTERKITEIYENELLALCHDTEFCGIWQFHQAANVLKCCVQGIYPEMALEKLCSDFNREFHPCTEENINGTCYIMWTTATKMSPVFNHFVPVIR